MTPPTHLRSGPAFDCSRSEHYPIIYSKAKIRYLVGVVMPTPYDETARMEKSIRANFYEIT
jgi:hypothetical protein